MPSIPSVRKTDQTRLRFPRPMRAQKPNARFLSTACAPAVAVVSGALANRTPCDPKTLTRAARDFAEKNPAFAVGAGLAAFGGS